MNMSILTKSLAAKFFMVIIKSYNSATRWLFFNRMVYYSAALMLIVYSVEPSTAYAYIDPNTGGYLFQILFPVISMVVAVYLFFKNQLVSLFTKFTGLFKKKKGDF